VNPANENCRRKCGEEKIGRHLTLVKVWVPKDKVVEIRSMAVVLLKESVEEKEGSSKSSTSQLMGNVRKFYLKGIKFFSRRRER
jgi:hypothetical protein